MRILAALRVKTAKIQAGMLAALRVKTAKKRKTARTGVLGRVRPWTSSASGSDGSSASEMTTNSVVCGDCRDALLGMPDACVQTVVTSPPYFGLRDYDVEGQLGLEPTPDEFVTALVAVFRLVRRVLRDDGTVWLNLGDDASGRRCWSLCAGGDSGALRAGARSVA